MGGPYTEIHYFCDLDVGRFVIGALVLIAFALIYTSLTKRKN